MKREDIENLQAVAQARYLLELRRLQPILSEESRLRAARGRLETLAAEARNAVGEPGAMQSLGADIAWQSWLSRTRRGLSIGQAQAMADKSGAMNGLRRAFGRCESLRLLAVQISSDRRSAP